MKSKEEQFERLHETEVLPITKFDCDQAIASEQQQQDLEDLDEVIASGQEQHSRLVADFDLSLLDV